MERKFEFRIFGDEVLVTKDELEDSRGVDPVEVVKDEFYYDIIELLEDLGILEWYEREIENDSLYRRKGDKLVGWRLRLWENKEKPFNDVE